MKLPIAPRIIAVNHAAYCGGFIDRTKISEIFSVYLYDKNSRTFCCEVTPSYSLIGLYTSVRFAYSDNDDGKDDEYRERMHERFCECPEDTYGHCSVLDDIEKKGVWAKNGNFYIADDVVIDDDENYDTTMENIREYYCGNRVV